MTMSPNYSDGSSSKMSGGKKVLIGCGIGCGTIILLIILAIVFGSWWLFSTEDQVPTNGILTTGSSAAFRLEDISKNQEMMQLLTDLSIEAQRINRKRNNEQLPESFQKFNRYFEGQQDPGKFVEMFAPKEATASLSSDAAGNTVYVIAANFGKGTRIAKMMLNIAFNNDEQLKGKKISTEYGDLFLLDHMDDWNSDSLQKGILGFCKGTFIFSNDQDAALSAIENLASESNTVELKETLSGPFEQFDQEGSLAFGVMDGSMFKNLDPGIEVFNDELRSEMKKVEISLDELSSEKGTLNLRIDWNNNEIAAKANEEIDKIKSEWISKAEQKGFDMEVINSLKDEQLDIQFRVNDLKDALIQQLQDIERY